MADLTRAEELVETMGRDAAFRAEVEAVGTAAAKRQVLDAHGFQDVDFEDMKAYVESKGGKLVEASSGRELSEQELAAVTGGSTEADPVGVLVGPGGVAWIGEALAAAA